MPEGTEVELRAPVFKVYGEDLDFVFTEVRKKGCRRLIVDGKPVDLSEKTDSTNRTSATWTPSWTASSSAASTRRRSRPASPPTLLVGDGLLQVHVVAKGAKGAGKADADRFYKGLCSPTHHFVYGDIGPEYFVFNNPESACRTCGGLGVDKLTHPGAADSRSEAQHPRRLFRARGVQVQPGHLGRTADVQPVERARVSRSTRRGSNCPRRSATPSSTASSRGRFR